MRFLTAIAALAAAAAVSAAAASAWTQPTSTNKSLASQLALARVATAKYVTSLPQAKKDGYQIITQMIPSMGYHFLNPKIQPFNITKPQALVYLHHGSTWQLGALEWVFPKKPATPPIQGAKYGAFPAACHYVDGTFVAAAAQSDCAPTSPTSGAKFNFWHPDLVTLHIWLWLPNPTGLYASMNPLSAPFDKG